METRTANLIIGTSGGTAGRNATNYKLALPSTWIKEMGLTPEQRQVELRFDGTSIVITRKLSLAEFLEASRHAEHKTLLLSCYSGDALCARIVADETAKTVRIENLATDYLKLPFGNNPNPSWADYQHFLEERCIPKTRAGLQEYLEAIGVDSYEPLEIIRKTQGRWQRCLPPNCWNTAISKRIFHSPLCATAWSVFWSMAESGPGAAVRIF